MSINFLDNVYLLGTKVTVRENIKEFVAIKMAIFWYKPVMGEYNTKMLVGSQLGDEYIVDSLQNTKVFHSMQ